MGRAYLRLDPAFFERKALAQRYPVGAVTALIGVLCLGESQPQRGRFRNERLLRALLEDYGKWIPYLRDHGDLLVLTDGRIYVDGWDEWQEGDWKVGERVARIRGRKRAPESSTTVADDTAAAVADYTVPTVYTPSDGGRLSVIDSGSGKRSDSLVPSAVPGREAGATTKKRVKGFSRIVDVDWAKALDSRQLEAWASFGPEWDAVKAAWLGRGLRYPPSGSLDDEGDDSQRSILWQILDAQPTNLPRWIAEAPKGLSAARLVGHLLERWHALRDEAIERSEAAEVAWLEAKHGEAETASDAVARIGAKP